MPEPDPAAVGLVARKEARARLELYGKTIVTVDGTNRDELRQWIERIDHAQEWKSSGDRDLLEMVGYLITGSLASHVWRFVKSHEGFTWAQVKISITETFLDLNEGRVLRQQVEMNQRAFEDPREYGLRFDEAVQMEYTAEQQAVDMVQEHLVHLFIRGLRNKAVRQLVHLGSPKKLADAITLAITTAGTFELADQDRKEEPMEIGAVGPARPVVPQLAEVHDSLEALRREMTMLRMDAIAMHPASPYEQALALLDHALENWSDVTSFLKEEWGVCKGKIAWRPRVYRLLGVSYMYSYWFGPLRVPNKPLQKQLPSLNTFRRSERHQEDPELRSLANHLE